MRIVQMGRYTVYHSDERSDFAVLPHPVPTGAEVIFTSSAFMDRGEILHIQTITEEEYRALQEAGTDEILIDEITDAFWRER